MDNILDKITDAAKPWYIRHWRLIAGVAVAAAVGSYILYIQANLHEQIVLTKKANDDLIVATTEYKVRTLQMTTAIRSQNEAIARYERAIEDAKLITNQAANKGATARAKADQQVQQILTQAKPATADAAVISLVDEIANLQWDKVE